MLSCDSFEQRVFTSRIFPDRSMNTLTHPSYTRVFVKRTKPSTEPNNYPYIDLSNSKVKQMCAPISCHLNNSICFACLISITRNSRVVETTTFIAKALELPNYPPFACFSSLSRRESASRCRILRPEHARPGRDEALSCSTWSGQPEQMPRNMQLLQILTRRRNLTLDRRGLARVYSGEACAP